MANYIPTTKKEMQERGWDQLDVIMVTGDSYIDSPFIGAAVIGKVLMRAGYRVGIIAQPDVESEIDITRLGEPRLFWGITAGCIDSMVANYTATKKRRNTDDYTPGGKNNRRPDRASIVYSTLIRTHFKKTVPIVLGGVEASLRRVAHFDYWSNKIRGSILVDAGADYLVYGMGEQTILELSEALMGQREIEDVRGICYTSKEVPSDYLRMPSLAEVRDKKKSFVKMFDMFYRNQDAITAQGLAQKHQDNYVIQNPPQFPLTTEQMDDFYSIDYTKEQHPYYEKFGKVRALDTIRFSIPTHRGCYGECNFCAIAVHEGRTVQWRSKESIIQEAERLTEHEKFKGYIKDLSAPTANMYGFECKKKINQGACENERCLFPDQCPALPVDHQPQIELLNGLNKVPGVKKVFVSSGIRYDMILNDTENGENYLEEVVEHHISGQMKVAPEHTEDRVLNLMGKPGKQNLKEFKAMFDRLNKKTGKKQFLTYYLIAAHPGCSMSDMNEARKFANAELQLTPEQVQIFTPTPSTWSSLMYYTEVDPWTGQSIYVEKDFRAKDKQKRILVEHTSTNPSKLKPSAGKKPSSMQSRSNEKSSSYQSGKKKGSSSKTGQPPKRTIRNTHKKKSK
jgi:uncharacterized radical SAM protein YgiQ